MQNEKQADKPLVMEALQLAMRAIALVEATIPQRIPPGQAPEPSPIHETRRGLRLVRRIA